MRLFFKAYLPPIPVALVVAFPGVILASSVTCIRGSKSHFSLQHNDLAYVN
jgi:hypothetical protein